MPKIPISFDHNGQHYEGWINLVDEKWPPLAYHVVLNNRYSGTLTYSEGDWYLDGYEKDLAPFLGDVVMVWIP